jgi:hypothetical protein
MSTTKGGSSRILEPVSSERAFYFYAGVGRPLGDIASSLKEFGTVIKTVDVESLEFHLARGDFEKWVYMLGDSDLAKSLVILRESKLSGEKLRAELVRVIQTRVRQIQIQKVAPKK